MFEPLQKLFDKHATTATEVLKGMRSEIAMIVENTLSRLTFDQFGSYSEVGKNKLELQNNEGCYWRIFCVGVTMEKEKPVAIYIGTDTPASLVCVLTPVKLADGTFAASSNQKFLIAPRSTLFAKTEGAVTVNLQVERLVENPEYDKRLSMSYDITDIDMKLQEPERHRIPRTEKPSPDDLRGSSVHA